MAKSDTPANPLPKGTTDLLRERREAQANQQAIAKEHEADYKIALNGVASTPNGELVLKTLIRVMGVFALEQQVSPASAFENGIKRNIYLRFIRPYLDATLRSKLES